MFLRQQIWLFASDLIYDFCLHVNTDSLKKLFDNMRFLKNYTTSCYRDSNKHSGINIAVDRIFCEHPVIDLTQKLKIMMRKRVQLLKSHLCKKFDAGFYLSQRSNFIHMDLDVLLFSIKNYHDFIDESNKVLSKELGAPFSRKIKKEKK